MGKKFGAGFLWGLLIIFSVLAEFAEGQEVVKVGILPFRVYAADREKLGDWPSQVVKSLAVALGKDERIVLVEEKEVAAAISRVGAGEMDEAKGREVGQAVDADYMLLGSLTQINGAVSLDVRILDVHEKDVLASAFAMGKRDEGVAGIVARLSKEIDMKVLKKEMVTKVLVEGNQAIEESAIRSQIKMKEGDIFSPRGLREDIKAVYKLGYFQDVRGEKRDWDRGKAVVIIVEEKPTIREVKFSGNKAIKTSELQEAAALRPRSVLNLTTVQESANKILKKYHDEAFFLAEVKYEIESPRKGETIVLFKITENQKVRIKTIAFSGNLHFPDAQLKKLLPETSEGGLFSWVDKSGTYKEDVLERDLDGVVLFYLQHGFMQAKVGKPKISSDKEGIRIEIPVEEGNQYKVGKVDILGDLVLPKEELLKKIPLYAGEILNRDHVRESVTILTDFYADKGYAFVEVEPSTIMRPEEPIMDLHFEIRKGSLVYFERINILGNTKTRDRVIRRELRAVEGDLYSLSAVKKSREQINRNNYFKEVSLNTKKGSGDDKLDLNVQVEEGPTGNFSIGGGYSSTDRLMAMLRVSQNNLFGTGEKVFAQGQFGSISSFYSLGFTEPWLFDHPISAGADLYRVRRIYDTYTVVRSGGGVRFGFPLFEDVKGYPSYIYEVIDVTDVQANAAQIIQQQAGVSTTSAVVGAIRRDTRDHFFDPTTGGDSMFSVQYAGGPLGGSNYFTKYGLTSSYYITPFGSTTYMAHGQMGYIQPFGGKAIPLYERYRLGGIYSIRGYKAYNVGPKDPVTGEVIGGDKDLVFNLEAIFPVAKEIKLKGVVFFDAGNAWDVGQSYNLFDLQTSVGFGVRWFSPIGPLRIEWGYCLNPQPGQNHSGWDFTVGSVF